MKQFNLEEYLANPSKKVITRDGRPVRIICTDRKGTTPIIALVNDGLSEELGHAFYSDGKIFSDENNELDLFFATEKHEGWVNLYKSGISWSLGANIWQTEEEAKKWVGAADYATTIKREWEE